MRRQPVLSEGEAGMVTARSAVKASNRKLLDGGFLP
jgi:hypothetical protein